MRLTDTSRQPQTVQSTLAGTARLSRGVVLSYSPGDGFNPRSHECVTRTQIAKQLAALKGYEFGGEYDEAGSYACALYFVPSQTLAGCDAAARLGIRSEDDLFGGVVPHPFVATKAITHPLAHDRASSPQGWSARLAAEIAHAVLPGYAAFTLSDARHAGERLLERGGVRVKPALAVGGRGQSVARDARALSAALAEIDAAELESCGVVLERNLNDVTTHSVGQVRMAQLVATYYGTQKLTTDNGGMEVYGGSDLIVTRGDFDALLALDLGRDARRAVMQARAYDKAAGEHYPGLFASRRNYDVAQGRDDEGGERCGVLEQSWRIGGASGAEIGALEVFHANPGVHAVRARCHEVYGESAVPPTDATVYFRGTDENVGSITKYTTVEAYADAR